MYKDVPSVIKGKYLMIYLHKSLFNWFSNKNSFQQIVNKNGDSVQNKMALMLNELRKIKKL